MYVPCTRTLIGRHNRTSREAELDRALELDLCLSWSQFDASEALPHGSIAGVDHYWLRTVYQSLENVYVHV